MDGHNLSAIPTPPNVRKKTNTQIPPPHQYEAESADDCWAHF